MATVAVTGMCAKRGARSSNHEKDKCTTCPSMLPLGPSAVCTHDCVPKSYKFTGGDGRCCTQAVQRTLGCCTRASGVDESRQTCDFFWGGRNSHAA